MNTLKILYFQIHRNKIEPLLSVYVWDTKIKVGAHLY